MAEQILYGCVIKDYVVGLLYGWLVIEV